MKHALLALVKQLGMPTCREPLSNPERLSYHIRRPRPTEITSKLLYILLVRAKL